MLPQFGYCLVYRSRPHDDDPELCVLDVWSLMTYPAGEEPERAELTVNGAIITVNGGNHMPQG